MNRNDFVHQREDRVFEAKINEIKVLIPESQMSDEAIAFAEKVLNEYPQRISAIMEYLSLTTTMEDDPREGLFEILQKPRIEINKNGGRLRYEKNTLFKMPIACYDDDYMETGDYYPYIIFGAEYFEIEFNGILESFTRVFSRDQRCKPKFNAINIRSLPGIYVGSISIVGVYTLIFSLIEDIMQRSNKENVVIKLNLLESDTCVLECEAFDCDDWLSDTEEYDEASLWTKVVKALSDTCEVHINNEIYTYNKGAFVFRTQSATDCSSDKVKIIFRLDKELFSYEKIEYYMLLRRMKELAQLNGHVTFQLSDEKNKNILHFSHGLEAMLKENGDCSFLTDDYYNPINLHFMEEDIEVSVFMTYGFEADVTLGYVNNIRTYDGGNHVQGLYDGIFAAFEKYMKSHMDENMVIMEKQVAKRLNFVLHVKMEHPPFQGAVKRGLDGETLRLAVKNGVVKNLYAILEADQSFLEDSRAICETELREIVEPY
ncbi:MAG: hypothetical protein FWD99_08060 [Oscillospiraceae bacterium]|nr:hypothetical protein [Oscillospiraceae bacterium]